jgi:hypothetical protein
MDCAPKTIADPAWTCLAELVPRCGIHDILPEKVVAFEWASTTCRFYVCLKKTLSSREQNYAKLKKNAGDSDSKNDFRKMRKERFANSKEEDMGE